MDTIQEIAAREIRRVPRGVRGSSQNLFRAVLQMVRVSHLSRNRGAPWERSFDAALQMFRKDEPGFEPVIAG